MTSNLTDTVLHYAAFTADPQGGNPAGVVLDAASYDAARMLAVATDVGYSETAFITEHDMDERRFTVRYFSPLAEVDFCGHATIAAAVALAERIGPGLLMLDTQAGEVPVLTVADADGALHATLTSVPTHTRPASGTELSEALAALAWKQSDLDTELPAHVAFGGVRHLVLAAATRARLADLDYDFDALGEVMRRHGWTTLQLVWRESDDLFHARDPFPVGGVVEDAATGAAAAAFGGYLRTLGLAPHGRTVRIHQGDDMGRPSLLDVDIDAADPRVRVSGQAVPIKQ
ncbi:MULTISPECIES: PhzF family phenazine biosynthesis isomerase [unclassified Streptomyces]|uniref:PhzF family phenazine biosynthesis isomerase n=1 Tax=unclassified Streptomyces TaxID=2593676 RepID=UPI0033B92F7E